ncbi:TerB family tellurite resistance protein [Phormidium sp. LEGE 05292]|uniref:tellurite resistance TerB family protein n=1 Tax=[Phormidium] sp. LEGE 05292 TaxID=767427 RepID=UPI00187E8A5E|nr:TerB family tellurite resistance protein [Phormidium sp. LEGE 05292]MBE9229734.1 TerB family tellurite resistance protein [Phormidium sp. LEGE 05292]
MVSNSDITILFKILVGVAWIDGKIQPEEREYLYRLAKEKGLDNDPEIYPWLYEFRTVPPSQCYEWVQEYLGDRPSSEKCQNLIEAISALIYSDSNVTSEEAELINTIQQLDPANNPPQTIQSTMLGAIQKLYKRWVVKQN